MEASRETRAGGRSIRVLLAHGLETPEDGGDKARVLRDAFGESNVCCPPLKLKAFRHPVWSPSYVIRGMYATILGWFAIWIGFIAHRVTIDSRSLGDWTPQDVLFAVLPILFSLVTYRVGYRSAVRAMLEHSLNILRPAILDFKPDVLVGSSWGGCCAVHLLLDGGWTGPLLLLAPAQDTVATKMGSNPADLRLDAAACSLQLIVVHSQSDRTIALADSVRLVSTSAREGDSVHLIQSDDPSGHRLEKDFNSKSVRRWVEMMIPPCTRTQPKGSIE